MFLRKAVIKMKKSVYSLVLSDSVVDAIDRRAAMMNTSRSNLINQVLAEYASMTTPEKRMNEIFRMMKISISPYDNLQVLDMLSDSMMALKSTLKFKYNPTVKYTVELYRNTAEAIGQLKVTLRTQNRALIDGINAFFTLWAELEGISHKYYSIGDGRYTRIFIASPNTSDKQIADHITSYVKGLDMCLKEFFKYIENPIVARKAVINLYNQL